MAEREREKVTLELTCSNCFKKQEQCSCEAPALVEDKAWWPKGYSLTDKVGENPRAVLYRCKLGTSDQTYAIKVMKASCAENRDAQRKVRQEVKVLTQLTHPNIGATYDGGLTDDSRPFFVRDYIDGVPLSAVLDKEGSLDVQEFYEVFEQVCEALSAAQQSSVSHFGLSPENIVLVNTPIDSRLKHHVKVIDFACANMIPAQPSGTVSGDPRYMSPEQIQGAPKEISTDVYSLGCVMYESLCGRPPFSNAPPESLKKSHVQETPEPLAKACKAKINSALEELVLRCLSKYPHNRFNSFTEILEELKRVQTLPEEPTQPIVPPNTNMSQGKLGAKTGSDIGRPTSRTSERAAEVLIDRSPERGSERPTDRFAELTTDRTTDRTRSAAYPKPAWLPEFTPKFAIVGAAAILVFAFASICTISWTNSTVPKKPTWVTLLDQAVQQQNLGNMTSAEAHLNNALAAAEEGKAPATDIANILAKLGSLYYIQNRPREAAPHLMRALPLYEEIQGANGKDVAWIESDVAEIALATNNWTLANEMFHKLLASAPNDGREAAQQTRARYLANIGSAYIHEHNYQQALKSLKECLSIQSKLKGAATAVSKTALNIAYCHDKLGQMKDAERFYKQSVDILRGIKPTDKAALANKLDYYGNFLKRTGKTAEGTAAINEARRLRGLPETNGDEAEAQ